ncbi:hypothetical protein ACXET9_14435 [Brachybacterium sp. DNPG3]
MLGLHLVFLAETAHGEPGGACSENGTTVAKGDAGYEVTSGQKVDCVVQAPSSTPQSASEIVTALTDFTRTIALENQTVYSCTGSGGGSQLCSSEADACEQGIDYSIANGDIVVSIADATGAPRDAGNDGMQSVEYENVNLVDGVTTTTGYGCIPVGVPVDADGVPIVISVSQEDFARLPVEGLVAHAGPEVGWVPVNMVVVLYAETRTQVLETELLGVPVRVRAMPVEFRWDLGDGSSIVTSDPGEPFPSEAVSSEYRYEGWYDIELTTTFAGQFSVDGGEWQDIVGTIEVASDPVAIFSKSFESRLVDGDVPVDEEADPWIPARTPDTEGPLDPEAEQRTI